MAKYLDDVMGDLVTTLKNKNLWDNTLLAVSSDNGGPLYPSGGANNYSLKGVVRSQTGKVVYVSMLLCQVDFYQRK